MKFASKLGRPHPATTLVAFASAIALVSIIAALDSGSIAAEVEGRRPLEHSDYDAWNTITAQALSPDGEWVMYVLQSGDVDGDPTVKIRHLSSAREYSISRGTEARFTFDSKFAIYRREPAKRLVKELEREETDPDEMPVGTLEILNLASGDHVMVERVKSFETAEENGRWLAYHLFKPVDSDAVTEEESSITETYEVTPEGLRRAEKPAVPKEAEEESESEPEDETAEKELGTTLVLRDLSSGIEWRFPGTVSYTFSKPGGALAFATSLEDDSDGGESDPESSVEDSAWTDGVMVFDLEQQQLSRIAVGLGHYQQLAWNDTGSELAFVTDREDYQAETPAWELYAWNSNQRESRRLAVETSEGIPSGWWISGSADLVFSEDGRRLFFGTAPVPESVVDERAEAAKSDGKEADVEDEDDDEPKAKLDVWHWQDPFLQPQQLIEAEEERQRSYRASFNLQSRKIVQLATVDVPEVTIDRRSSADVAVANSNYRYRKQRSWQSPATHDIFLVDLKTGEHDLIQEGARSRGTLSPGGKFVTWWDGENRRWLAASTGESRETVEISRGIGHPLENELHDRPELPNPYGIAGWLAEDEAVLVYDRFDLWQLDPTGEADPICVTSGLGREEKIRFRYLRLDPERRAIDPREAVVLSAFDELTKSSGFYRLVIRGESEGAESSLTRLVMLDESLSRLALAEASDRVIFRRSTFRKSPDIWSSTLDFKTLTRVSDANPQQDEFTWGSVEQVRWQATDGQMLDGLLYKPDGFDPTKKHPMIVYFYERNSDNLHTYHSPGVSRSRVNFSFYVSRGYLFFVPDIPYKTGEPGPSAENSVLSGVRHIVAKGFVDQSRIGMQGHSWGGYQVAYLVTRTNMFACAEAGAPVSNMTSAYGGIRWGTGLSRMHQYEQTQSRIGSDLWSAREKYIANSPLFFVDKIETPLLILHNDQDGAVPWYQGIELFVAMRRLEKPAWMLNYNGEPHSVVKHENRVDFTIRMQQFFDHYLMDAPEPEWMAVGVRAVDKGEKFGLELLEPKESETEATEPAATGGG